MTELAFTRRGTGDPMVLVHGIGGTRQFFDPVIGLLAEHFDVIAVDLPGHGGSVPLPAHVEPHPAALAAAVAGFLDELDIATPHVTGNSLGGWIALELAAIRPVASLALLSPAGMWKGRAPLYNRISLWATRFGARYASGMASRLVEYAWGRKILLGQTHGQPARISPDYARMATWSIGTCRGWDATMKATVARCYRAGPPIEAPITVEFGERDFLLRPHESRHLDELPPGTPVESLPGCGHVPMSDDPDAVATFVIKAAARAGAKR